MELDDLKQSWKQTTEQKTISTNNIMEMIQHKSYGPVATLKRRFRKRLFILPLVVTLLINTLSRKHDLLHDVLFWYYIAICAAMCFYFAFSYQLLNKMQCMDCGVKSNLERQVNILEKGFEWRMIIVRGMLVVFILLLEVMMHYNQEPSLAKWQAYPIGIRLVGYAIAWILFYLLTKFVLRYKYGRHIQYLKSLVQQM